MPKPGEFLKICKERGFLYQCTDEEGLGQLMQKATTAYIGFDCTAPTLHVGSLVQIMMLRWLQACGHKPIILLGGATTKIGDPSGKDEMRKQLTDEEIAENMAGIKQTISKFIEFEKKPNLKSNKASLVDNSSWFSEMTYIEFLNGLARDFSVKRMLSMDSVKRRLEREDAPLSLLELNYMVLQAYDFYKLAASYKCRLQIGGSDQWGNIVMGVDLWRRIRGDGPQCWDGALESKGIFGLTTPLITTASGTKMGKTAEGAVWLTAEHLSPYDYWQFWRNTEDADVGRFLRLFTELPIKEIEKLEKLQGAEINEAKIILANEATTICHGKKEAEKAAETARKTFEQGGFGDDLPVVKIPKAELKKGIPLFELLHRAGLAESKGAARRLIEGGGGRVNDEKWDNPSQSVTDKDTQKEGVIKLSAGKKKHALVKVA